MIHTDFWRDGLRILCVWLDNLGDVLMTTPAFRALKATWPACHLTLLTSSAGAAIGASIPEIDAVIRYNVPWQVANRVLYVDVPVALRSRNVLLQHVPERIQANASPEAIVQAVQSLIMAGSLTPL